MYSFQKKTERWNVTMNINYLSEVETLERLCSNFSSVLWALT